MFRLAIVGFGQLARRYYVPALRTLDAVEIVAVADPLATSLAAATAAFPRAKCYSDHRALFDREQIDAVVVASPPSSHLGVWIAAALRGLPSFIEKPFVLQGQLGQVEGSPAARRLLMPNFNRRFWPTYRTLRELFLSGSIGTLERADLCLQVNPLRWSSVTKHRLSSDEGGALYDLGSSQLDLIEYVFKNRIASLSAHMRALRWPGDHVRLDLQLESGLQVTCELAYASPTREKIAIVGTTGVIKIRNANGRILVENSGSGWKLLAHYWRDALALYYRAVRRDQSMLRYTIRAALAEFVNALCCRSPFSPNFEDAVENALCLEAAVRSVERGTLVEVIRPKGPADAC